MSRATDVGESVGGGKPSGNADIGGAAVAEGGGDSGEVQAVDKVLKAGGSELLGQSSSSDNDAYVTSQQFAEFAEDAQAGYSAALAMGCVVVVAIFACLGVLMVQTLLRSMERF